MNQKSISARDLKAWKAMKISYRTVSFTEHGCRFFEIDIMDRDRMNSMTIRFQLDMESKTLFQAYGGRITDLSLGRSYIFMPIIKEMCKCGYQSNGIRKVIDVLKKNNVMRLHYVKDISSFVPYGYRNDAKRFLDTAAAVSFSK